MKAGFRLLAAVKPARYLEAGNPTGLTGLRTHPSLRPYLIYLYGSILNRLINLPESSVYKQSTEALTKHRLQIVEGTKPAGYDEWKEKASKIIDENREKLAPGTSNYEAQTQGDEIVIRSAGNDTAGDGGRATLEGPRSEQAGRIRFARSLSKEPKIQDTVDWEPEPPLEASQISEIEERIGAGLIEEIIQVAEGELKLVDTMTESRVWEELEEKPQPGQWEYFARNQHMSTNPEASNK